MTLKEFKEYILQHMTVEEAFDKMLQGGLITYEKLKFNEGEAIHPEILASFIAMDLGWNIVLDNTTENVEGIIIGTEDFIKRNLKEKK